MKLLEHPNIVRLFDVWENRNELYLIMEYVDGGELFHHVDERKGLPEDETVFIFRQIVSALLYCHRLLICHRDLKPENILLNQRDLTVKLIDFGMAALQPEGRLLSTPCGSPHYAAPEVVSSKPYDGTQADVWSCGVILYVMLTGSTPYNYSADGDIRALFRDIAKAHYYMPPELSSEARDLIKHIFVPEPTRRITMDEVWEHPLLHKYDERFGYKGESGSKEAAIGPVPSMDQWKVKRIQDIDREILRNMRTLWHSETEQALIQKLLNNEHNQEKLFYAALVKHREEHLENYVGNADDMDYSASDYHHSQPPRAANAPAMPSAQRTRSQFSIMNDEHLERSHSFVEPPPSVSSYDPYRASKNPIVNSGSEYLDITVHRNGSASTRKASVGRSLRHPNALRVEMLKHSSRRTKIYSSSSLPRSGHSRASMQRSSISHNSLTSSVWPSSPPIIAATRPCDRYKRGVSFGHIYRNSAMSAGTSHISTKAGALATPHALPSLRDAPAMPHARETVQVSQSSSPVASSAPAIRSRKGQLAVAVELPKIKVRKPESSSQHMRSEVRKLSAELEKACEEAFFRSSVGSNLTAKTSITDKPSPYGTPPSSVSGQGSRTFDVIETRPAKRPLPDLPKDTPNTYLTRTLEETREKLAAYKSSGDDVNTAKFEEVMKMLEHIMPSSPSATAQERRSFTAPERRTPDHLGFLPMITEESDVKDMTKNWRSLTTPVQKLRTAEDKTVRVVPPSSPGGVAPLNVRKRSSGSESSDETRRHLSVKSSYDLRSRKRTNDHIGGLTVIDEDSVLPSTPTIIRKKRSGWFGGFARKLDEMDSSLAKRTSRFVGLDDRHQRPPRRLPVQGDKDLPDEPPPSAQPSEFPLRKKRFGGGKGGFSKWLGRKRGDQIDDEGTV